jgi:hypothetical protein
MRAWSWNHTMWRALGIAAMVAMCKCVGRSPAAGWCLLGLLAVLV